MGFLRSFSVDDNLVSGFVSGSDASFEALMGRYATELFNTALYISGDLDIAEQVLTEVFCEAYRNIPRVSERTTVRLWFYRLTIECALRLMEEKDAAIVFIKTIAGANSQVSSEVDAELGVSRRRILEALNRLPIEYNIVFVLKDVNGFSASEAREVLEIDDKQFQARLTRARLMILRDLDNHVETLEESDAALETRTQEVVAELTAQ